MGSAGVTVPTFVMCAFPHIHGFVVIRSTSSMVIVHGLPFRHENAPGASTVPFSRRKVIFLMAMSIYVQTSVVSAMNQKSVQEIR